MNYLSNLIKLNNRLLIVKKYNLNNVRIISTKTTINFYQHHTQQQQHQDDNYRKNDNNNNKYKQWYRNNLILLSSTSAAAVATCLGIYTIYKYHNVNNSRVVYAEQNQIDKNLINNYHRTIRQDLPTYRMADVSKFNSKEAGGIWITYGIGVYDITKFIPEHPGSDKIMLGAGNAIDPFWQIYQQHNTPEILKLLETFRIGNLNPADEQPPSQSTDNNPWANEPKRHPILRAVSEKPFNAEPPPTILVDSFITPVEFFYVRNHLPVPKIDIDDYELEVEIENTSKKLKFNYKELNKLPKHSITAVIMCSGNRRSEMNKVKPIKGLSWSTAAVGNAIWTGPKLYDILRKLNVESDELRHVHFEGLDLDPTATPYAASIPLAKAMDPRSDIILAIEMNGKPLNPDHGYPLRVVVPGVTGARSVKWLGRICVSEKESNSHWQQNDYKGFSPSTDWDTVDFTKATAIQNMPVTSAICLPENGKSVQLDKDNCINIQGYAWSGGGNSIVRVDITIDGGKTWHVADLINGISDDDDDDGKHKCKVPTGRSWAWTLWTIKIPVSKGVKEFEIWSKAVDSNYNVQPETFENTWNLRGVLSNAYHRIKVAINNK